MRTPIKNKKRIIELLSQEGFETYDKVQKEVKK